MSMKYEIVGVNSLQDFLLGVFFEALNWVNSVTIYPQYIERCVTYCLEQPEFLDDCDILPSLW